MSELGLRNCVETEARRAPLTSTKRIGLCLSLIGLLFLGACVSDGGGEPPVQKSQAQNDLRTSAKKLGKPLDGTTEEAMVAGGILGSGISFGVGGGFGGSTKKATRVSIPLGMIAGTLAGRYVSAKQREYSAEVEVVEAITEDIRSKNQQADRTIASMEVVVAEDRARLADLRGARALGEVSENTLKQQIALAEDDLATMNRAVKKAEEHYSTFADARTIVLKENTNPDLPGGPEMSGMDTEIEVLRARIRAMKGLVDELASVS